MQKFPAAAFELAEDWNDDNHEAISFPVPNGVATEAWLASAQNIVALLSTLSFEQIDKLQADLTQS